MFLIAGEFGVVYRARLTRVIPNRASTISISMQRTYEIVAVKTLKGEYHGLEKASSLQQLLRMTEYLHERLTTSQPSPPAPFKLVYIPDWCEADSDSLYS